MVKFARQFLYLAVLLISLTFLIACSDNDVDPVNEDIYALYQLGVEAGLVEDSYEDWLLSIKGEDAQEVSFQVASGFIQWKRESDETWTNLYQLSLLIGPKGDSGVNGREVSFRVESGHIQWQYDGEETWTNLIEIQTLIGAKGDKGDKGDIGDTGENGREVIFRVDSGHIQWQYVGEETWTNLIENQTLIGAKGD
jgi:hypothetical protein